MIAVSSFLSLSLSLVTSTCPSCWSALPVGNNVNVVAIIEDKLYFVQQFETVPLVSQ